MQHGDLHQQPSQHRVDLSRLAAQPEHPALQISGHRHRRDGEERPELSLGLGSEVVLATFAYLELGFGRHVAPPDAQPKEVVVLGAPLPQVRAESTDPIRELGHIGGRVATVGRLLRLRCRHPLTGVCERGVELEALLVELTVAAALVLEVRPDRDHR